MLNWFDHGVTPELTIQDARGNIQVFQEMRHKEYTLSFRESSYQIVDGLKGVYLHARYTKSDHTFEQVYWWTYHNGFDYTFLIKQEQPFETVNVAKEVFKEWAKSFKVINRKRFSPSYEKKKISTYKSKNFHYSINVKYSGWSKWLDLHSQIETAETGFLFGKLGAFISMPYYIGKGNKINAHTFSKTILQDIGQMKNINLKQNKTFKQSGMTIFQQDGSSLYNGLPYELRLQLRSYKNYYYMFMVVHHSKWTNRIKSAFKILDLIRIDKSKLNTKPKFDEVDLKRHAYFYNRLGLNSYEKKLYSRAEKYYKKATEYHPKYFFVGNLINSILRQGNIKKAYRIAMKYQKILKEDRSYYLWIPFLLGKLDRNQEAIQWYEKVFNEGFYKYSDFKDYVAILIKVKNMLRATTKIKLMLKKNPSLELYKLLIDIYTDEKKYNEAIKTVKKARSTLGDSQKLQKLRFEILEKSSDLKEMLKYANQLEREGYLGFNLYFYRGYAWHHLNKLSKAKIDFQKALEYDLGNKKVNEYLKEIKKAESKQVKVYRSKRYHYKVNFGKEKWYVEDDFKQNHEYADASFYFGKNAGLLIFAVNGNSRGSEIQDIAYSLLRLGGFEYKDFAKNVSLKKVDGIKTLESSRQLNKTTADYLVKISVKRYKKISYLFLSWINTVIASEGSKVFSVLQRISIDKSKINRDNQKSNQKLTHHSKGEKLKNFHFYNNIGVSLYRKGNYVKAEIFFKQAFDVNKTTAILGNLLNTYKELSKNKESYRLIKKNLKLVNKSLSLLAWLAYLESEFGSKKKAVFHYKKLFKQKYWDVNDFKYYINTLISLKQLAKALKLTKQKIKEYPKDAILLYVRLSKIYEKAEKPEKALTALKEAEKTYGYQYAIAYEIVEVYYNQKKYKIALKHLMKLQKKESQSFNLLFYEGLIYYKLNWYRKSKVAFERALKKSPQHKNTQDYVDYLASLLGQGSNYNIKQEIKPVEIPKQIKLSLSTNFSKEKAKKFGGYYNFSYKMIDQKIGRPKKTTYYYKISVLSSQAADEYSSFQFTFDPVYQRIYTNKLIVRDSKNKIISKGNVEEYYVVDKQKNGQAVSDKELNIPISGLEANTSLELMVTIENLGKSKSIDYESRTFSHGLPTAKAGFLFCGDVDRVIYRSSKIKLYRKVGDCLEWSKENIAPYIEEPYQRESKQYLPTIWLGDKILKWEKLSDEYLKKISRKIRINPEIKSMARKITKNIKRTSKKIEKIFEYVQRKIKYKAIEFGTRGQLPFTGIESVKKKYGDCKDHSVLIFQLLNAMNIKSNLVLVNTEGIVVKDIPSLDQFNHMITYVPQYEKSHFIDATQKNIFLGHGSPMGLSEKEVLILKRGSSFFQKIKKYNIDSSILSTKKTVKFELNQDKPTHKILVKEVVQISGYYGSSMRSHLKDKKVFKHKSAIQEMMSSIAPDVLVKSVKVEHLKENIKPIQMSIHYEIPVVVDKGETFHSPSIWETYYIKRRQSLDRKTPFQIYYPLQINSNSTLLENSKVRLEYPKKRQSDFSGKHIKWDIKLKNLSQHTEINYNFVLDQGAYTPKEYTNFFDETKKAYKAVQIPLKAK